jgi:hypothetical protein
MSSIRFDADLDTSKLEAGAKRATKIMTDFVRQAENAGVSVEKYLGEAIQKQYAKVDKLVAKTNAAFDVIRNKSVMSDADIAKGEATFNRLATQRDNAIRKLEVMKLAEQSANKVAAESAVVTEVQGRGMGSLISTYGKGMIAFAALSAVIGVFNGVMSSTTDLSNRFKATMAGAKGSLDGFFFTIRNGDWSNLISNMASAAKNAKEFTEETQRYNKVRESEEVNNITQNAQLVVYMAEARAEKNALEERQQYYAKYVAAVEGNAEQEVANAQINLDALITIANKRKDVQKDWIKENFGEITRKQSILSITLPENYQSVIDKFQKKYRELQDLMKLEGGRVFDKSSIAVVIDGMRESMKDFLPAGASFNDMIMIAAMKGDMGAKALDALNASAKNLIGKQGSLWQASDSAVRLENSLGLNLPKGSVAKLKQELDALTREYDRATTNALRDEVQKKIDVKKLEINEADSDKRRKLQIQLNDLVAQLEIVKQKQLAKTSKDPQEELKITLLELNKQYQHDLANWELTEAEKALITKKYNQDKLDSYKDYYLGISKSAKEITGTGTQMLDRALTRPDTWVNKNSLNAGDNVYTTANPNSLRAIGKGYEEAIKKQKAFDQAIKDGNSLLLEQRDAFSGITSQIVQQMKLEGGMATIMDGVVNSVSIMANNWDSIGGKDGLGGLTNMGKMQLAFTVISTILSVLPDKGKKYAAEIEHQNKLLDIQAQLIERASQDTGGEIEARQKEIELLKDQTKSMIELATYYFSKGKMQEWSDTLSQVADNVELIKEKYKELDTVMRGGITAGTIKDAIIEGFKEGKTTVKDFGDYMNDVLFNAVMNVFGQDMMKAITDSGILEYITSAMADSILTDEEIKNIKARTAAIAQGQQSTFDKLTGALTIPGTLGQPSSISGTIERNITEDTGTELAGLMRKISDDNRMNRDYNKLGVDHLINIENNTFNTVLQLQLAVTELQGINKNTKQTYTGAL